MAKLWEIRESYGDKTQDPEMEAYECGYEEGYQAAMDEMGHSGSRMGYKSGYGMRGGMGQRSGGEDRGSMGYRHR